MNNVKWKFILGTAGVLGLAAGIAPIFLGHEYFMTTLPIAMMFATYWLVPRIKENRFMSAMLASVLAAVVGFVVYYASFFMQEDATVVQQLLLKDLWAMPMLLLVLSVAGSWFFVKVHGWSERKRAQIDAKYQAKEEGKKKPYANRPKKKFKKKK